MRLRILSAIAGALGTAVAAVPALAVGSASTSATFQAYDYGWMADGNAKSTRASISPGGAVTFSYPRGRSEHNADFRGGPRPSSCAQTAGPGGGGVPPVPHVPTGAGWTGSCTFNSPGVYKFHCDVHPFMTGTIVVAAPGSPLAGNARHDVSVASVQRGTSVRGTVRLSGAAAGGWLEVNLRTDGRVGRLVKVDLQPGTLRFSVSIDARTKRALERQGRITVKFQVIVRAIDGMTERVPGTVRLSSA